MKIYAISDLHLSNGTDKPMDIFGESWIGHWDKIRADWNEKVKSDDIVLIAGDISWAMNMEQAEVDLKEIDELVGKKIIIKGNHDYWWSSYKKIQDLSFNSIYFIQNNAKSFDDYVFCGTRGWLIPDKTTTEEDEKIYHREILRLELSLKSAAAVSEGKEIIGLIHYPPFNSKYEPTELTDLFSAYGVKKVIYGHLHGAQTSFMKRTVIVGETEYYLTSCDFLHNRLAEIIL